MGSTVKRRPAMNQERLHHLFRLVASGFLSLVLIAFWVLSLRDVRWCILQGGIAGAAVVLLIPVLVRGDSWQKMLAGMLLFFPSFNLVMAAIGAASYL